VIFNPDCEQKGHGREVVSHFKGTQLLPPPEPRVAPSRSSGLDLADLKGQESAKRALEIAAAGGHNLLMCNSWRPHRGKLTPTLGISWVPGWSEGRDPLAD
jgi:predicted ATPase with chaperone activity